MSKLSVKVIPRSRKQHVEGPLEDGSYKLHVNAPPVEGAANEAVVELLAKHFKLSKSRVRILKGETSRQKLVEIEF